MVLRDRADTGQEFRGGGDGTTADSEVSKKSGQFGYRPHPLKT